MIEEKIYLKLIRMIILENVVKKFTLILQYALFCFCVLLTLTECATKEGEQLEGRMQRPNILFAFSDDQSWLHTGAFGNKIVKTPAFDRVANEGIHLQIHFLPVLRVLLPGVQSFLVKISGV